jgi:hypothetical protein
MVHYYQLAAFILLSLFACILLSSPEHKLQRPDRHPYLVGPEHTYQVSLTMESLFELPYCLKNNLLECLTVIAEQTQKITH